ncbi:MAG TPA: restriction endonuclease subunit S [Flavobacteriaceae bacterium]|nr:restriction endonuclease subunit S [Flavobacteriaceae bacterium]
MSVDIVEKEKIEKVKWRVVKLKNLVEIIGGGTPSKSNPNYYQGDIPWASVRDLKYHKLYETEFKITNDAVENSSTNIIPKGNIIIATRVGLGKVVYNEIDTAINQDLKGLIISEKIERNYLFYYFLCNAKFIERSGTGATVKGVKLKFIKELDVPLPPPDEQRLIVQKLDRLFAEIDAGIALIDQNIAKAEALKLSVLDEEFSVGNGEWKEEKLKNLIQKTKNKKPKKEFGAQNFTYLDISSINKETKEIEEPKTIKGLDAPSRAKRAVQKGDVLFATTRPNLKNVAIIKEDYDKPIASTGFSVLRVLSERLINSYLFYYLIGEKLQDDILPFIRGAQYPAISDRNLKNLKIPIPGVKEQQKIVQKLDALFTEMDSLVLEYNQKRENLEALKSSLLDRAF